MNHYSRFHAIAFPQKLLLAVLLNFITLAGSKGQYFIIEGMPCPVGDKVELDTMFYTPNGSLPFDRCFYLKFTINTNQKIKYFSVSPIDKKGISNPNRRDYRIFFKNSFPDKSERKKFKEIEGYYKNWKSSTPFKTLFTEIFATVKGNKQDMIIRMPPLAPNREYRVYLITDDMKVVNELIDIGSMIIKSHLKIGPGDIEMLDTAERSYKRSMAESKKLTTSFVNWKTFETFKGKIGTFELEFRNKNVGDSVAERRISFMPVQTCGANPAYIPSPLSEQYYWNSKSNQDPVRLKVEPLVSKMDLDNNGFEPFRTGEYQVVLTTVYKKDSKGTGPVDRPEVLGILNVYDSGLKREFAPNDKGREIQAKLSQGPLKQYFKQMSIVNEMNILAANGDVYSDCMDHTLLEKLMRHAVECPCESKGIKDLTQKDELLSILSLFYENNALIMQRVSMGYASLKEPNVISGDSMQYAKRVSNLKTSISQTQILIDFLLKVSIYEGSRLTDYSPLRNCLYRFQEYLKSSLLVAENAVKNDNALRDDFISTFQPVSTFRYSD